MEFCSCIRSGQSRQLYKSGVQPWWKETPTGIWIVGIAIRVDLERALAERLIDFFLTRVLGDAEQLIGARRFV
jgi:hypothetical protein